MFCNPLDAVPRLHLDWAQAKRDVLYKARHLHEVRNRLFSRHGIRAEDGPERDQEQQTGLGLLLLVLRPEWPEPLSFGAETYAREFPVVVRSDER